MKSKVLIFIIAVAAILTATTLYFEARLKKEVDQIIRLATPFAAVSYEDLNVGVDGSISLEEITVIPHSSKESITVDLIKVSSSDPFFLLFKSNQISLENLPERLSLNIEALEFNATLIEQFNPEDACGAPVSAMMYSHIGFDRVSQSGQITANLSDPRLLVIDSKFEDQLGIANYKVTLGMFEVAEAAHKRSPPPIEEIYIGLKVHESARKKAIEYCATDQGLTPQEYTEIYRSPEFMRSLFGADMGPDVGQAFVDFANGQGDLEFTFSPSPQLDRYSAFQFYEPHDILRWLRPAIKIDGRDVVVQIEEAAGGADAPAVTSESLGLSTEESRGAPLAKTPSNEKQELDSRPRAIASPLTAKQGKADSEVVDSRAADPARAGSGTEEPNKSYQQVDISSASRYIDKHVRITRNAGKAELNGWLNRVEDGKLVVEISRYGSRVVFQIPAADISKLEVYR